MRWFRINGINGANALARVAYYTLVLVGIAALVFVVPQLLLRIIEWIGHLWQTGPLALWLPFKPIVPLANAAATRSWVEALSTILVAVIVAYVLIRLVWTLSNSSNRSRLVIERFTDAAHPLTKQNEATSTATAATPSTSSTPSTASPTDEQLQLMSLGAREALIATMRQIQHIVTFHRHEQGGLGKYRDPLSGGSVATMDYALGAYAGAMADAPLPKEASWVNPLMGLLSQPRCTRVAGTVQFCPYHPGKTKAITFEIVDITTTDEPEIFTIPSATTTQPHCLDIRNCARTSARLISLAPIALALELLRRDMLNHPRPPVIWGRRHAARVNNFIAVLYGRLANTCHVFCYERTLTLLHDAISLDTRNYRAHANLADRYTIWGQQLRRPNPTQAQELHQMAVAEYQEALAKSRFLQMWASVEQASGKLLAGHIPGHYVHTNQLILLHAALARAQLLAGDVDYCSVVKTHLDTLDHLIDAVGGPENITNYRTLYYLACLYAVYAEQHDRLPEYQRPQGATWAQAQEQASLLLAYSLVRNSKRPEDQDVASILRGGDTQELCSTMKIEDPDWYYWKRALKDEDLEPLIPFSVWELERLLLPSLRKDPKLRTMTGKSFVTSIAGILQRSQERKQTPVEIITGSSAPDGCVTHETFYVTSPKRFQRWWWHRIQVVVFFVFFRHPHQ